MNLQDLIHKKTWKEIQGYLAMSNPPGIILSGVPGLGKFELGLYIAAKNPWSSQNKNCIKIPISI